MVAAAVVAAALFALIVGGFLWPRPQFEEGRAPWTLEPEAPSPAESLRPGSTRELEPTPGEVPAPE